MGVMHRHQGGIQPRWVSEEGEAGQEPQRLSLFARNSTNTEPKIASHPVVLLFFLFPTLRPECLAPSSELLLLGVSTRASSPEGPSTPDYSLQIGFLPHLPHCPHHVSLLPLSTDLQEVSCVLVCYPHQIGRSIRTGSWSYSPIIPLPGTESLHKDLVKESVNEAVSSCSSFNYTQEKLWS